MKRNIFLSGFLVVTSLWLHAQDIIVHDPVLIKQAETFYLFCTGRGISVFSSPDMKTWTKEEPVFDAPPKWAVDAIPEFKGHIWAPDISYVNGQYLLYYSVSAFGKNTSCIGLATNTTLNPKDSEFKWVDHGKVIQSIPGRDLWNAIDPNLIIDNDKKPWLVFGSFWSGMKLFRLSDDLKKPAEPQEWYSVSKRERDFKTEDRDPSGGAVEAPFIFKKNGFYYLFVSFDYCCRGLKSNYKVVVGRATDVRGPYLDKDDNRLDQGGGSVVIEGNKDWAGVGHNSAYTFDGADYFICHAYDVKDDGKPKLMVRKIKWDDNQWPIVSLEK
jgi:arabinan endo-1,5-alpha-L-arabinosidase